MNSASTTISEKKITPARQALEKGMQAFDAKNFDNAVKYCELGMKLRPEAKDKYQLLNYLTSSKASICFFKQEYRQAIDCYSKAIEEIETDLKIFNNQFKADDISDLQRIEMSILIEISQTTLGILYARRCQTYSFINKFAEAAIDYGRAGLYKMEKYATKLRHISNYVLNNLNKLPENKSLQNSLALFRCAEKYWEGVNLYGEKKFSESIPCFIEANKFCKDVPDIWEHLADAKLATHSLCKSSEDKLKLMAEIIEHATQFIAEQPLSKMFFIRGIAYTMNEKFLLGYNDFVLAMQKEILFLGNFDEQMWPLVENSLRCFIFCQLQLIKNHKLTQEFLTEETALQDKLKNDNYRFIHQVIMKLAAICKEKQELELAQNLYCFALWISHRFQMPELDSPSAAAYLSCIIPDLQTNISAITFEEIDNLKKLLFRLSEKKREIIKKPLSQLSQMILNYSQHLVEANQIESAKQFYNYVKMIQPESSVHYKFADVQLEKLKISEQKPIIHKQRKKKVKMVEQPLPIVEDAKKIVLELKQECKTLTSTDVTKPNKENQLDSPLKNSVEKSIVSLPLIYEIEVKYPITVPVVFRTITDCMRAVGVKQIYATGETLCGAYFPQDCIPEIEIAFGDVNPSETIKKVYPGVTQEGCFFRVTIDNNVCVTFRNSEPLNNVAKMLEQKGLSKYDIKKLKYQGIQEDVNHLNDFTLFSIYVEYDEDKLVGYDPKQRGFDDLCQKRIKCVGETSKTIINDPCVALKTIYYSKMWNINISETITNAIVELKQTDLAKVIDKSPDRMNQWISKLFLKGSGLINFERLRKLKLLEKIVPEFDVLCDSTNMYAQSILVYLQCALAGCDTIVFKKSTKHRPEFNVIYATWEYAIQLLKQSSQKDSSHSNCNVLFNRSFSKVSEETRKRFLLSAEHKWKSSFFSFENCQKDLTICAIPDKGSKIKQSLHFHN